MNLRKLIGKRNEIGLTQKEIAVKLGISECSYRMKEQGKREFTANELVKISQVLKTDVSYFFAN